jgi:hypothetical protein
MGDEHIDPSAAMTWDVQNAASPTFDINIGTDSNCNDILVAHATGSIQSYTPAGLLEHGTQYFWRVDVTDGGTEYSGSVWSFTTGIPDMEPIVIEDFDDYYDTGEMLVNWSKVGEPGLVLDDLFYGSMQFEYDNQASPWKSEAVYTFATPQDWNATGLDTFKLSFYGLETNDPEPMYLAISDGTVTATVWHRHADAATDELWQNWYIRLSDFSGQGLDLGNITMITIGIGDSDGSGGTGSMVFDDLSLVFTGCIVAFQLPGDLNQDCVADLFDLALLADNWLMADYTVTAQAPNAGQLLAHYNFNESPGSATAVDSSSNGYNATVSADDLMVIWDGSGYSGGCINLDSSTLVTLPEAVFSGITDEVTVSLWINGDPDDYPIYVNQVSLAGGSVSQDPDIWDSVVWPMDAADSYGGTWNHYAAVKDATSGLMRIYHNGVIVAQVTDAMDSMEGSSAQATVLSMAGFDAGTSSTVKLDDLQIYGYALSHAEIVHLATGGAGPVTQPIEPVFTGYDLNDDGIINLGDFAIMAAQWLTDHAVTEPVAK